MHAHGHRLDDAASHAKPRTMSLRPDNSQEAVVFVIIVLGILGFALVKCVLIP